MTVAYVIMTKNCEYFESLHEKEVHFETCFYWQGVMHHKFIPEYTVVSRVRYMETLVHLWEVVCQKHPEI
jgi:hypothetical protein